MRKIKTMEEVERIRRRNNIILGLIMIALLVGSSLGYSLMSADGGSESVVSENGFDFVRDGGMWKLAIDGEIFGFQNLPSEVSDINVDISTVLGAYSGQPLYFVNPGDGTNEILMNIGKYVLRYQESCLEQELGSSSFEENKSIDCAEDLPTKDCSSNVIIFEVGNETLVYGDRNCVFIAGDVLRGSDAFLYKLLGVN